MALEVRILQDGVPVLTSTDDDNGMVLVPTRPDDRTLCLLALSQAMLLLAQTHISEVHLAELKDGAENGEALLKRSKLRLVGAEGPDAEGD